MILEHEKAIILRLGILSETLRVNPLIGRFVF